METVVQGNSALVTQDSSIASCLEATNTPTPWLTLLLVLVNSCVKKNSVKQVKWNQLIKTEGNLH